MTKRRRIIFVVLTWFLILLVAEGGARALCWWQRGMPPHPDASVEFEWRWAERHLAAKSALLPSNLAYDPETGWRVRPSIDTPDLHTNRAGMRGAEEFTKERTPGKRRLLCVGDSYTFGHEVRDDETYAHLLAARVLADCEVLNLGVPGFGTDQQILQYETTGRDYAADVVVLGFFVRDYSRNLLSFRDYAKPRFVETEGVLALEGSPVPTPEWLYEQYSSGRRRFAPWWRSRLFDGVCGGIREWRAREISDSAPGWRVLSLLMERFCNSVRAGGAVPVWLVIPTEESVREESHRYRALEDLCRLRARELALPCLALSESFAELARADPSVALFRTRAQGGHMAPAGNLAIARSLARFLFETGLLR